MGWDIFISHASEDKPQVAVPLKQALEEVGISVWIDIDQSNLGDSFRSKIDFGLQRCRFGVVILSPHFFRKKWAKAELDALYNMSMSASGQKRLLPVICGMTYEEVQTQSPLVAGLLAVRWEDGLPKVVEAIAGAVTGAAPAIAANPAPQPPPAHSPVATDSLVLLMLKDGRMAFAESLDVECRADGMDLSIKCGDPTDTALVQELGGSRSDSVAVAFDTTAMLGRVTEAVLKKSGRSQIGVIKFKNAGQTGGNPMEMSFAGYSADKLAEMRARRILLNERFARKKDGSGADTMNQTMLERFIAGFDGAFKAGESLIPKLFSQFSTNPDLFLALTRLASVMCLRLSDTVEAILRLDLRLDGKRLHVDFAGRRARKFSNVDPPTIEVKGTLHL